ncbi:MAG TPA: hypothetical protein VHL99_03305 [Candidatus Binatia bacterium]|nr:hypothetical protein [Candidatus Binatia bacterium]
MNTGNGNAAGSEIGREFYRHALITMNEAKVPVMVGGAYALERYTGIWRDTKDIDLFIHPDDCERALRALAAAGCQTELTFPHWLGKAYCGEYFADLIFSSGNGTARVDDGWFEHAVDGHLLDIPVKLCPVEEMIWSKSFVMERERYDGADVAHLLRACGRRLDWQRLLQRFGQHWRVLYSYVILFGFIYPSHRAEIPTWVMDELTRKLADENAAPASAEPICQGTLVSREQYLIDIQQWGYKDARLQPKGNMTLRETEHWTAAIDKK